MLYSRAFPANRPYAPHPYWIRSYTACITPRRVDRLIAFLRYATLQAQRLEQDGDGWYGTHVRWAIDRLCLLGYTFPECDQPTAQIPAYMVEAA
jgi:hypothetical protein